MGYHNHSKISEIRYVQPALLSEGDVIDPSRVFTPLINPGNTLYRTLFEFFNKENYLYPRFPIDLGLWDDLAKANIPNVLRLPLRNKGTKYHIPSELADLRGLLEFVINYEKNINPYHEDVFCHITVDNSHVKAGEYHRYPGFHADGFQGTKLTPKLLPEHSYIFVSAPATELCIQPFFLQHLDDAKHNMFQEMDRQAHPANIYRGLPGHLYLFDPYVVHRTPEISQDTQRLFIRITFTFAELDHPKNTVNPMLAPYQYPDRIDIRENLRPNEFEVPYQLYGVAK